MEYTLFQPGIFVNYLTYPHKSMKYVHPTELPFDFENRRALIIDDSGDAKISLITVDDFSKVVARAIDFEGEWPIVGGVRGTLTSIRQLIALGEKVRGASFGIIEFPDRRNTLISRYQEGNRFVSRRSRRGTLRVVNGRPHGCRRSVTLQFRPSIWRCFQGSVLLVSCWLFLKMPIVCLTLGIGCFQTTSLQLRKTS